MLRRRKRRDEPSAPSDDAIYFALRDMVIDAVANGLEPPSPEHEHPDVYGLVVDIPAEGGYVTVAALADDTTSMYTSVGGGIIGSGATDSVAHANHRLLAEVQGRLDRFAEGDDGGLPGPGIVRLHVLTAGDRLGADVPEDAFWGAEAHELTPVIAAVQDMVTAMREATPAGEG